MRHQIAHRQLSRSSSHRRGLLRNMATSLLKHERFETTLPKAKEVRPVVESLIGLAKRSNTLAARRQAYGYLYDKAVVHKLFAEIAPRYADRNGGFTRIVRTRIRHGDAAQMALIELIPDQKVAAAPKASAKAKSTSNAKKTSKSTKASETADKAKTTTKKAAAKKGKSAKSEA